MKKSFKGFLSATLALAIGITGVNATATKTIDSSTCETVYTNYYFFIDANTPSYFNSGALNTIEHSTIAEYHNNSYQVNFDSNNVGYGQMDVSRTSKTSNDGITSMSLDDFYSAVIKAGNLNGSFTDGAKNYIVSHNWYSISSDGSTQLHTTGVSLNSYSIDALKAASLDADANFTLQSSIAKNAENPFKIRIDRKYKGYLTGSPIVSDTSSWYLNPQVYYIQYCSPKAVDKYTVTYVGNAANVTNVPEKQTTNEGEKTTLSTLIPERPGYVFLGWSLNADSSVQDTTYDPGKIYDGSKGNITLYAIWKEEDVTGTYTISYRPNTSDTVSNMPLDVTKKTTEDALIASETPVRAGYTFLGWSPDYNATTPNDSYKAGSSYTDRKDLVLYAIWKKNDDILPENPKTGISDYILPFGGTIGLAGLGLGVLKKKKTIFRQL